MPGVGNIITCMIKRMKKTQTITRKKFGDAIKESYHIWAHLSFSLELFNGKLCSHCLAFFLARTPHTLTLFIIDDNGHLETDNKRHNLMNERISKKQMKKKIDKLINLNHLLWFMRWSIAVKQLKGDFSFVHGSPFVQRTNWVLALC